MFALPTFSLTRYLQGPMTCTSGKVRPTAFDKGPSAHTRSSGVFFGKCSCHTCALGTSIRSHKTLASTAPFRPSKNTAFFMIDKGGASRSHSATQGQNSQRCNGGKEGASDCVQPIIQRQVVSVECATGEGIELERKVPWKLFSNTHNATI